MSVYRKAEIPARFHYGTSPRIGDIVVIADEGWALSSRERFRPVAASESIKFRGGHGFDNQLESMRALFIGHGAAFKKGQVVEPFANVDVYNVMAKILKLKPAPNDGNKATVKALLR